MIKSITTFIVLLLTFSVDSASSPTEAKIHLDKSKIELRKRHYDLALNELELAENALNAKDLEKTKVAILMRRGLIMLDTGRKKLAAKNYKEAYFLAKKAGKELWQIHCLTSLAQSLSEDYDVAMSWLDIALQTTKHKRLRAEVYATRALIASWHEKYDDAIENGDKAFKILKNSPKQRKMALAAISASAFALMKNKNYSSALIAYNEIIARAYEIGHWQSVHRAYCSRAEIFIHLGQKKLAKQDLVKAIEGLERERAGIPWTQASRARYLHEQISAYDNLIITLADEDEPTKALEIVERFQAKSFFNLFDEETLAKAYGIDNNLLNEQKTLIQTLHSLGQHNGSKEQQLTIQEQLQTLQSLIEKSNPKYEQLIHITPVHSDDVQFQLDSNQVIINYWVNKKRILIWIIEAEKITFRQIPIGKEKLTTTIKQWLKPMNNPAFKDQLKLTKQQTKHINQGKELYQWLFASIESITKKYDHLIVIPDATLQNLPFESLITQCQEPANNYHKCHYLGLEKAISYNDSMTSWMELIQRKNDRSNNKQNSILAYAANNNSINKLSATLDEINYLKNLFPQAQIFSHNNVTEQSFKMLASKQSIIHIASHGILDNNVPMNSGLLFLRDKSDDGFLSAYEIVNLKLENNLTTLSACQSGNGQLIQGAGLIGLSQSFLKAGSSAVIATRWKIADQPTADFFNYFYSTLKSNKSYAQSLLIARQKLFNQKRVKQLAFKAKTEYFSHPSYWSGFRLNGID